MDDLVEKARWCLKMKLPMWSLMEPLADRIEQQAARIAELESQVTPEQLSALIGKKCTACEDGQVENKRNEPGWRWCVCPDCDGKIHIQTHVVVPVEPTKEMVAVARNVPIGFVAEGMMKREYKAMIEEGKVE